ncbi:MAG TPA: helix-turn-helix domain-containing protein [Solirubrobacteraceae bacterium]|nr:helix-turn-helix domain-containing protein [Solirubrobacteraceae bacterium]
MPRSHQVVALALDGVVLLDLAAPTHLFGHCGPPHYSFTLAALRAGPVRSSTGIEVLADSGIEALEEADTIVVPGFGSDPDPAAFARSARAVAAAHARGARVLSICTGAFVLAEAGILDGRRATTHWESTERLARQYPRVSVDPAVLYIDEGDVMTSAGVAAGLDLCLHVIRRDHGAALAAHIARRTVVAPHRDGGQAQFVTRPPGNEGSVSAHASLEATRAWALDRLDQPLDVAALARRACMSPRSFARHFREETGTTPAQWVLDQRTRVAQSLLETTDLPVEHVAQRTGFGSSTTLRTHFGRRLATTPTAYRRAFRER